VVFIVVVELVVVRVVWWCVCFMLSVRPGAKKTARGSLRGREGGGRTTLSVFFFSVSDAIS